MKYLLAALILVGLTPNTWAKVAKVKLIRGKVFIVVNGKTKALKKGDWVDQGATLKTKNKSFLRLIFTDKSTINLGPNSELKVDKFPKKKEETGLLTLVKGQIRAQVPKDPLKRDKSKLQIRTKTAAMGIRGTDLQIVFNEENNITNTITFEGEVAMVNMDPDSAPGNSDQIERQIQNEGVSIKDGQFSIMTPDQQQTSIPTGLNPTQLSTLEQNTTFAQTRGRSQNNATVKSAIPPGVPSTLFANDNASVGDTMAEIVGNEIKQQVDTDVAQSRSDLPPPEGVVNDDGSFAPPGGGFVDLNTGLYIPPPPGSQFDANANAFIPPPALGGFDPTTGNYVAPEGLELQPDGTFSAEAATGPEGNSAQAGPNGEPAGGANGGPGSAPLSIGFNTAFFGGESFAVSNEFENFSGNFGPEGFDPFDQDLIDRTHDLVEDNNDNINNIFDQNNNLNNTGTVIFNITLQ